MDWLDQGGTSDDVRFLRARFAKNPKSSGVDIFWGGGSATYVEIEKEGLFVKHDLPKELKIPQTVAGVPLFDGSKTWYGAAMSSFGIFYNKKLLKMDGLPEPKTWEDLAKPIYLGNVVVTDPRRSGSANTMNTIILQGMGWDKGWDLLTSIAGNTRTFTHSSSDPIKSVVSGDAAVAMAIDFYAMAKVADLGSNNLGFVLPAGQTVLDPDPVAVLKGAPNKQVAHRFVNWLLSPEAQALLVLPKGAPGGPRLSSLGRMSVNPETYKNTEGKRIDAYNPFNEQNFIKLDLAKASKAKQIFNDLVGAVHVDTHHDLKKAWAQMVKRKASDAEFKKFGEAPLAEEEFYALAKKWSDGVTRNKLINQWIAKARSKYNGTSH